MKKVLLILLLCLPFKVYGDDDTLETCMDANYSRILTASHKIQDNVLELELNVDNPSNVSTEVKKLKSSLEVRLYGAYMARERVLIGKYVELKDMGGWTRIRVRSGKDLISNKTKGNFIQLSIKI
tara:strand:+ start:647 stop:1021 length:375 start_codon:yes stop_codon:yes gene_type:complete